MIIEGLHLDFPGSELIEHLQEREDHHTKRAAFYEEQVESLRAAGHRDDQVSGGGPLKQMEEKIAQHRSKSRYFFLLSTHLLPGETYRLELDDLARIDLVDRHRMYV